MARLVLIIADSVVNHLHQQHGHCNSQQSTYNANGPLWPTLAHSSYLFRRSRVHERSDAIIINFPQSRYTKSPNNRFAAMFKL